LIELSWGGETSGFGPKSDLLSVFQGSFLGTP
jgi:hypothetical protein